MRTLVVSAALAIPMLVFATPAGAEPVDEAIETHRETTPVAAGVTLDSFDRWAADGWLRADSLTVDLTSNVTIDYLHTGEVSAAAPISEQVAAYPDAVAAINGDFFDINDTSAPLGVGIQGGELVTSAEPGRTNAVAIDTDGIGRVLQVDFEGTVTLPDGEHPLAALNTGQLPSDAIGEYTRMWGGVDRSRVVDGSSEVYEVTVTDGVVTAVSETPGKGTIDEGSFVLVGREAGAATLASLSLGDAVTAEYSPTTGTDSPLYTAVGGAQLVVVDGEVPDHADQSLAPRTAVGFSADGSIMYLLTVDGRQTDSVGVTIAELGEMMRELGAHNALNLDGGGSSTMLARQPGQADLTLVNNPSDGEERSVPNGLAISVPAGSGELVGYTVGTAMTPDDAPGDGPMPGGRPDRVFPGLTRQLFADGYDEAYAPVSADARWSSSSNRTGKVDESGVFHAKKSGTTTVTAKNGKATGDTELTVLGELARLDSPTTRVGLADRSTTGHFGLIGYDAAGFSAPIAPGDAVLEYDADLLTIIPGTAGFEVTANAAEVATHVTVRVDGHETVIPVTVGLTQNPVADFTDAADWTFSAARADGSLEAVPGRTGSALGMTYDFTRDTATRAAYAAPPQPIAVPGQPQSFSVWIDSAGNGEWPTLQFSDGSGAALLLRSDYLTWEGWQEVRFQVPAGTTYPLTLTRIYVAEVNPSASYHGEIAFDDLVADVPPDVDVPERPVPVDSTYTTSVADSAWRFAVMSDAQFVAARPDSDIVASARRTLAEIKASSPDFLIINGDLVDEGSPADLTFARQILTEELGDEVPWYYVPGNHEVMGGEIGNFVDEFGDAYQSFDHSGTRFITLDTSGLKLRSGGFDQLTMLRDQLADAAADPAVNSVVVVQHVPPRDPLPQAGSQLTDRKDAEIIERWLGDFAVDTGKGIGFVGAHVGVFHASAVDGVPYVINGNSGKGPAAGPQLGGFIGWTEFGVDPVSAADQRRHRANPYGNGPQTWLRAATHVQLDELTLSAPDEIAVGDSGSVETHLQQQGETLPVVYPMAADWSQSTNVHVGDRAPKGKRYSAWYNPLTGELTALRDGEVTLTVTVNGHTRTTGVTITKK